MTLAVKGKTRYLILSISLLSLFCITELCLSNLIVYKRVIDSENQIRADINEIKGHNYESHSEKVFVYNYLRTTYGDANYKYNKNTVKVFNLEIGGLINE